MLILCLRINTLAGEKGFIYAGPKSWIKLPYCIRHAVFAFKVENIVCLSRLPHYLMQSYAISRILNQTLC